MKSLLDHGSKKAHHNRYTRSHSVERRTIALAEHAAERLAASGQRAFARGDMAAAANLLGRAAALFPPHDSRRLNLLPSLGRSLIETGAWERAETVLQEAVEIGPESRQPWIAADALVALCWRHVHTADSRAWETILADVEDATRILEAHGDAAGLARALSLASVIRFWRGEAAAAIPGLERAALLARKAGDRAQETENLCILLNAARAGPMPVAALAERAAEIRCAAAGNRKLEIAARVASAYADAARGRFDVARAQIHDAQALAEELSLTTVLAASVLRAAGEVELLAGEPAAAERQLRPACEALENAADWGHFGSVATLLAEALCRQGQTEEATRLVELTALRSFPEDIEAQVGWRRVKARLAASCGKIEDAERLAREATALAARTDYLDLHAQTASDLAQVLRLAGKPAEHAIALDQAIRLFEQKGNLVQAVETREAL